MIQLRFDYILFRIYLMTIFQLFTEYITSNRILRMVLVYHINNMNQLPHETAIKSASSWVDAFIIRHYSVANGVVI